jgi:phage host-nuclease inhibitor protein Gam
MHNYTPDFIIKIKKAEKYEITVIEIKPAAQMEKPKEPKNVNKKSIIRYKEAANVYLTNVSKMKALDLYCKERNWKIFILTEKNWKDLYTI